MAAKRKPAPRIKVEKRRRNRTVKVKAHCRRPGTLERVWERASRQAKEWGF